MKQLYIALVFCSSASFSIILDEP